MRKTLTLYNAANFSNICQIYVTLHFFLFPLVIKNVMVVARLYVCGYISEISDSFSRCDLHILESAS